VRRGVLGKNQDTRSEPWNQQLLRKLQTLKARGKMTELTYDGPHRIGMHMGAQTYQSNRYARIAGSPKALPRREAADKSAPNLIIGSRFAEIRRRGRVADHLARKRLAADEGMVASVHARVHLADKVRGASSHSYAVGVSGGNQ